LALAYPIRRLRPRTLEGELGSDDEPDGAFPKARLVAASPVVVTFTIESTFDGAGPGFAVQPAMPTPKGGNVSDTAFFVSSAFIDFFEARIDVWSLGGTSTLNTSHISLTLDDTPLDTQVFVHNGFVWASQRPGPTPILEQLSVDSQFASGMDQLDQGDFRMQQVVQSNGRLYSALGTAIGSSKELAAGRRTTGSRRWRRAGCRRPPSACSGWSRVETCSIAMSSRDTIRVPWSAATSIRNSGCPQLHRYTDPGFFSEVATNHTCRY
jgi:hypothetical protein